ncbi:hypothetical protein PFISCL1PPCAC_13699, partial [Pristionchus fissidentatus]
VVPLWLRAQITNNEFFALMALVLCETNSSSDLSHEAISVLDQIRAEVYKDLQRFYRNNMGLSDYSTRLGNLISLNHAIQECLSVCIEFTRLQQTIFDL